MTKRNQSSRAPLAASLAALAMLGGLGGCTGNSSAFFTGDASMRIDVEVYKGPIAQEPDVQWGKFQGYVSETEQSLKQLAVGLRGYILGSVVPAAQKAIKSNPFAFTTQGVSDDFSRVAAMEYLLRELTQKQRSQNEKKEMKPPFFVANISMKSACEEPFLDDTADAAAQYFMRTGYDSVSSLKSLPSISLSGLDDSLRDVFILNGVLRDTCEMHEIATKIRKKSHEWNMRYDEFLQSINDGPSDAATLTKQSLALRQELRAILRQAVAGATQFKIKAAFWAFTTTVNTSDKKHFRQYPVSLQLIGGEYEQRIVSAANALLAQMDYADRREVPISAMLADSNPTAFVNQILWSDVAGDRLTNDELFSDSYALDRVRVLESIYTDDTWSRINTVHASGAGDVRMALIKDEIGNWNLKNFDQDTTQLVSTYKGVGLAALKSATSLMSGGATSAAGQISKVQKLVGLANQVALGTGGSGTAGNPQLATLRAELIRQLQKLSADAERDRVQLTVYAGQEETLSKTATARRDSLQAETNKLREAIGSDLAAGIVDAETAETRAKQLEGAAKAYAQFAESDEAKKKADEEAKKALEAAKNLTVLAGKIRELEDAKKVADHMQARYEKSVRAYDAIPARVEGQVRVLLENYRRMIDSLEIGSAGESPEVSGIETTDPSGSAENDRLLQQTPAEILQRISDGELDVETFLRAKYEEVRMGGAEKQKKLTETFAKAFQKRREEALLSGKRSIDLLETKRSKLLGKMRAELSNRRAEALDFAARLSLLRNGTTLGFDKATGLLDRLDRKTAAYLADFEQNGLPRRFSQPFDLTAFEGPGSGPFSLFGASLPSGSGNGFFSNFAGSLFTR